MNHLNPLHPDPERRMDGTLVVVGRGLDAVVASRLLPTVVTMADFVSQLVDGPEGFVISAGGARIVRRSDETVLSEGDSRDEIRFGGRLRQDAGSLTLRVMDHRLDIARSRPVLAQCAAVARIALERIAAGDRLVTESDFAHVMDCAASDVIGPPVLDASGVATALMDGIHIGTPWYPGGAHLHGGHPRIHDAHTLHWTLDRGLSALGVWMLDGRLTIGPMRRMRRDETPDPISRMRRSAKDMEILAMVEAMGLLKKEEG